MQTTTDWSNGLDIEVRGDDVVSHTGTVITRMLSDRTGLTGALSDALARPDVIHDRGRVLADMSLAIADGATSISDIDVLGDQRRIFSYRVASAPVNVKTGSIRPHEPPDPVSTKSGIKPSGLEPTVVFGARVIGKAACGAVHLD